MQSNIASGNALPCRAEKVRLQRELALEAHITRALESVGGERFGDEIEKAA